MADDAWDDDDLLKPKRRPRSASEIERLASLAGELREQGGSGASRGSTPKLKTAGGVDAASAYVPATRIPSHPEYPTIPLQRIRIAPGARGGEIPPADDDDVDRPPHDPIRDAVATTDVIDIPDRRRRPPWIPIGVGAAMAMVVFALGFKVYEWTQPAPVTPAASAAVVASPSAALPDVKPAAEQGSRPTPPASSSAAVTAPPMTADPVLVPAPAATAPRSTPQATSRAPAEPRPAMSSGASPSARPAVPRAAATHTPLFER